MSNLIEIPGSVETTTVVPVPVAPVPRCPVTVRAAVPGDLAFIDGLQKMHTHMVGWMPGKQIEEKIGRGDVLVAEEGHGEDGGLKMEDGEGGNSRPSSIRNPHSSHSGGTPAGYIISHDQYMGRDDVGIIYQLNVLPLKQRSLIGATLVKAAFERAAWGCRLFCCWCAQDICANWFWESVGFIPLAFRTGSRAKQRIHIYWQRRVREDDTSTSYWFPFQTGSGALREDRLVIPIPQGTHWRDVMPVLLPQAAAQGSGERGEGSVQKALAPTRPPAPLVSRSRKLAIVRSQSKALKGLPPGKAAVVTAGGIRYIEREDYVPEPEPVKPKRAPRAPAAKHDPKQIAAARELRDRYLEHVNTNSAALVASAKYEVGRLLAHTGHGASDAARAVSTVPQLSVAA